MCMFMRHVAAIVSRRLLWVFFVFAVRPNAVSLNAVRHRTHTALAHNLHHNLA
jgi:hypothetical protein